MISIRRAASRVTALAAAMTVAIAAVPSGGAAASLLGGCPASTLERPFTRWLDLSRYVLMPNGGFESGTTGWTLSGAAATTADNESYYVRGTSDTTSLALPSGASATTSGMCVSATSPALRFFARNTGSPLSTLKVEVLYRNIFGASSTLTVATLVGTSSWQPTFPIAFLANLMALPLVTDGTTNVAFRFTPQGSLSGWRIDDVYVDPFKGE